VAIASIGLGISAFRWLVDWLTPAAVPSSPSIEASRTNEAALAAGSVEAALDAGVPGLSPEITPNEKFYVVSKNVLRDPTVNEGAWRLEISGLVSRPVSLSYAQIRRMPSAIQYFTLQCISNEVGGDLIGNAAWRGVWLADLLRDAGIGPGAVDVVFRAADDYSDSIPIAKAMETGTMLAYEMNGEMLPRAHGFPARLLAPDLYGMKNVKWVTRIEVLDYDFKGYWQTKGWTDVSTMNTTSRIDAPRNNSYLRPGPNYVGGVAVAGRRGVRRVEVSADGGHTWTQAVTKPALGPNAWVLWLHRWDIPEGTIDHRLLVRATDGNGEPQSAIGRETIPDGASGYHAITIRIAHT
jgi:DMSO/TMAO reductase YedYZ molybdopterin-dependent catalytic subunit